MKTIEVSVKGVAPLLQHKFSVGEQAKLASKTKRQVGANKGDVVEDYLYTIEQDGKMVVCQPAEHFLQAMIKRASNYKIGSKGKKTYKEMSQGCIVVLPEMIPHKLQDWVVDERTVVIGATRGRIVRLRPKLNEWELDFVIQIMNDELPVEVVKGMLDDAGREGGIGDYRPRFGKFIVTCFKEV